MSSASLYDTEDMMSLYQTSAGSYEDSGALPLLDYIGLPHTKPEPPYNGSKLSVKMSSVSSMCPKA